MKKRSRAGDALCPALPPAALLRARRFRFGSRTHCEPAAGRTGAKQAGPTSPGPWLRKRSLAAPLFAVRNFSGGIAHDRVGDSLSCVRTTGDTYWRQGSELRATIVLT